MLDSIGCRGEWALRADRVEVVSVCRGRGFVVGEIVIEVDGFPPAKTDSNSLLGAGHQHNVRVKQLLLMAQQQMTQQSFQQLDGPTGLEITLQAPEDKDSFTGPAYIAGITEVLASKAHLRNQGRVRVDVPVPLLEVNCFRYDRQLVDVRFRFEVGKVPHYRVRVWSIAK
jgi:hypothetical protein